MQDGVPLPLFRQKLEQFSVEEQNFFPRFLTSKYAGFFQFPKVHRSRLPLCEPGVDNRLCLCIGLVKQQLYQFFGLDLRGQFLLARFQRLIDQIPD